MKESGTPRAAWDLEAAARDSALMADFHALCATGGRLAGSDSEAQAQAWALARLQAIAPHATQQRVPYDGWRCTGSALWLLDAQGERVQALACKPLLRSLNTPAAGLVGEVVDVGQGRAQDFARIGAALQGKIALVRHEYPFAPGHLHRRRKYEMARSAGAVGFLIANHLPGAGVLSGSSGRTVGGEGIPAAYIDYASGECLAQAAAAGSARVALHIAGEEVAGAQAAISVLDLPGGTGHTVVLSAHLDGHDLGCSALDNATGVSVVLAAARALAGQVGPHTHGLRVCLFSAEEWALAGSAQYLAQMDDAERAQLALNINLDTVAGDRQLTALISDYPALAPWIADCATASGVPASSYLPLMPNSDHANFAAHGIPALRLVAGFDAPDSRVRHILSAEDQPGIVHEDELRAALRLTCAMAYSALHLPTAELLALRVRTPHAT